MDYTPVLRVSAEEEEGKEKEEEGAAAETTGELFEEATRCRVAPPPRRGAWDWLGGGKHCVRAAEKQRVPMIMPCTLCTH